MTQSAVAWKERNNGFEKRTDGLWTHSGKLTVAGGPVTLPDGAIDTSEIAANAVQQQLNAYFGAPTFSTTATGSWVLTPVAVSINGGGGLLRVEWNLTLAHSTAGALAQVAVGYDNTAVYAQASAFMATANQPCSTSGVVYTSLSGAHTVQLFVINYTGGTLSIVTNINSSLYVTEQKR